MTSYTYTTDEIKAAISVSLGGKRMRYLHDAVNEIDPQVADWIHQSQLDLFAYECDNLSLLAASRFCPRPLMQVISRSYAFPELVTVDDKMYAAIDGVRHRTRRPFQYKTNAPPFVLGVVLVCEDKPKDATDLYSFLLDDEDEPKLLSIYEPGVPSFKPHKQFIEWKHDDGIYLKQTPGVYSTLTLFQDGKKTQRIEWKNRTSVLIGIRKEKRKLRLYDRGYLLNELIRVQARRVMDTAWTILFEIKYMDKEWQYTRSDEYGFATIYEFSGRSLVYWDYTDVTCARRMVCPLFLEEQEAVSLTNLPTEMENLVLEFLVPFF